MHQPYIKYIREAFLNSLKRHGFVVKKFKLSNDSIFSKFSYLNVVVSFEALFKRIKNFVTKPFEMYDRTFMTVYTLSPEDTIAEKVLAYKKRRKVRDLYDVYSLLRLVGAEEKTKKDLKKLLKDFKQPIDVKDLKVLKLILS